MMRVSVIMTCHNYADLIGQAIKSVFAQDYPHLSLWIVDDGSTDGSQEVIQKVCPEEDSLVPVSIFRIEKSMGPAWCKNFLIEQAWDSSDLFAFLDADDIYLPGKVAASAATFHEKMKIGLVYTDEEVILPDALIPFVRFRSPFVAETLNEEDTVGSNYVVSKKALEIAGKFDTYFQVAENYELARRIANGHILVHIPEPLVRTKLTNRALRRTVDLPDWEFFLTQARAKTYGKTQTQQ